MNNLIDRIDSFAERIFKLENFSDYKDKVIFILVNIMFVQSAVQFYKFLDVLTIKVACWPFFQSCGPIQDYVLLNVAPGYRPLYFSFLFFLFTLVFYAFYKNKYGLSFLLSFVVFCYNLLPYVIFTDYYNPVITYFNMYFFYTALIIFFSRHSRRELLAIFLALSYLFPGYSKLISEHWVIGLIPMPYIPNSLLPIFTNLTTISQLIFPCIFLFGRGLLKKITVYIQELYHAYSATLPTVGFNFLYYNGPLLLILYLDDSLKINRNIFKKNIPGLAVILLFIFMSNVRIIVPFNDTITKEAVYGINVFSNPYKTDVSFQDKNMNYVRVYSEKKEFDPYSQLRQIRNINLIMNTYPNYFALLSHIQKENCIDERPRHLMVKLETIYNSYEVIDEKDYCKLTYSPFSHNSWINPNGKYVEDTSKLNSLQLYLHDNRESIELILTLIYFLVVIFLIYKFMEED